MPMAHSDSSAYKPYDHNPDELREQLARIVLSKTFSASSLHRRFLSYVVDKTIDGGERELKGYTVGVDVFDRPTDFDSQVDPIVRIQAGRLRRTLERYYITEGKDDPIVIEVPKGGYVPCFSYREAISPNSTNPSADKSTEPSSVAVRPFRYFGSRGEDQVAEVFADEVSVNLARFRHLTVIPSAMLRSRTFEAQFIVGGSIQVLDDETYSKVWLVENETGKTIWSDEFECSPTTAQPATSLRDVAATVAAEVGHPMGSLVRFLARLGDHRHLGWRALHEAYQYRETRDGTQLARVRTLLEEAVNEDPRNSEALALLSIIELDHAFGPLVDWSSDQTVLPRALDMAEKAVAIDPHNSTAHQAILETRFRLGDTKLALEAGRRAIRLNPNHSTLLAVFGAQLCYAGNWEEGKKHIRRARLNLHQVPSWFRIVDVFEHYQKREYRLALRTAEEITSNSIVPVVLRAMLYGKLIMTQKGRRELQMLSQAAQGLSRKEIKAVFSVRRFDKATVSEFMRHLESVGLNDFFPAR